MAVMNGKCDEYYDNVELLHRHEVTQGGHGGGWNESTSIDKVHCTAQKSIIIIISINNN